MPKKCLGEVRNVRLVAAFGGGLTVKLLEIVYKEVSALRNERRAARQVIERHLDPILKSADELVGKIRALAVRDFTEFTGTRAEPERAFLENRSLTSLLYLFSVFWCRLELLRQESLYVELVRDKRGRTLKAFINCLESQRLRIIDRISQRAVGELMISHIGSSVEPLPYIRVAELYEVDKRARAWIDIPLSLIAQAQADKGVRQTILRYGTILHALTDTLDPKHHATKDRPSFANKLSIRSKRDLKFRVFRVYVPNVKRKAKYYGRT